MLAGIAFHPKDPIDDLLAAIADTFLANGKSVAGYVQKRRKDADCGTLVHVRNLRSGDEMPITKNRGGVEQSTRELLQKILDDYGAGVAIAELKMQKADPPKEVIDAFNDVQRARQDQERSVNEAVAYRNDVVPRAKGEADKLIAEATAYKERVIKDAQGEAERFNSVYDAYLTNKDVTKRRLYLERMQDILSRTDKVILDEGPSGSKVVPYLPLNELNKSRGGDK